jgi:hypothetical protein
MASVHILFSPDETQIPVEMIKQHNLSVASLNVPNAMSDETIDTVARVLAKMTLHTTVPSPTASPYPPIPEDDLVSCSVYEGLFDRIVTTKDTIWGRRPGLDLWVPLWPQAAVRRALRADAAE